MLIGKIYNERVARLHLSSTMKQAAQLLVLTQASDLVVVDDEERFLGVVSEGDLIRAVLPDFEEVVNARGSLDDAFRIFLDSGKNLAGESIQRLLIEEPITVAPEDELLKAATIMVQLNIRRLPVVEDGKFLGTVSRADVCWALLCKNV